MLTSRFLYWTGGVICVGGILILCFLVPGNLFAQLGYDQKKVNKIDSLNNLGLEEHTNLELALFLANEAQELASDIGYEKGKAQNNVLKGRIFSNVDFARSFSYYLQALKFYEKVEDPTEQARVLLYIGELYERNQNFGKGLEYLRKALTIIDKAKNTDIYGQVEFALGNVYFSLGRFEKAKERLVNAEKVFKIFNNKRGLAEVYDLISRIHLKNDELHQAWLASAKSLEFAQEVNDIGSEVRAQVTMAQILELSGELTAAIAFAERAYQNSLKSNNNDLLLDNTRLLAELHQKAGNLDKSVHFYESFADLKDKVHNTEQNDMMARMQVAYDLDKKDQENLRLKEIQASKDQELQFRAITAIGITVLLVAVGIMAVFTYRSFLREKNQNERLSVQNSTILCQREKLTQKTEMLEKLIQDKDRILDVVTHDLRSPLNRISGLVNIMRFGKALTQNQEEALKLIEKTANSGKDIIRDLLESQMTLQGESPLNVAETEIEPLVAEVIGAYSDAAKRKEIQLNVFVPYNLRVKTDSGLLKRILDNLLSNAIKYSPAGSSVFISSLSMGSDFEIRIKDQGPGFSAEDKKNLYKRFQKLSARPTGDENSTGLGLSIVKSLTDKLLGSIELVSEPDQGAEFILTFPKRFRQVEETLLIDQN